MSHPIGTLAWAETNGGRLTFLERVQFLIKALNAKVRLQFSKDRPIPYAADLETIRIPDSAAIQNITKLVNPLYDRWLIGHNVRTYLWGAVFAQKRNIKFDEELLFIAAVLHDLGLTPQHSCQAPGIGCFAVEGALEAKKLAAAQGWSAERQDRLAEAITLHLNISVDLAQGAEAHLLNAGAAFDVAGSRFYEIAKTTREDVLAEHPRHNMKQSLIPLLTNQADKRPHSRMGLFCANGFLDIIQRTKFPS